ncbi:hypothetical protein [Inediibacterium massiliense]|uniref:hypothetical protein n=1 Tax=Inediibacterium massiliense TaxID=1658111 RepID=UPI0006B4A0EB|nr:hypothetical protein [Inediibacterium massiliense]
MSRARKAETKKIEKRQIGKRWLVFPLIMMILISGILFVDRSYRSMMMIHEPKVFGLERINEEVYAFIFCGKNYYINKKEIYQQYNSIKKDIITFVESVKKQKEILLK